MHRANEFTLAGLRPGRDATGKAVQLYKKAERRSASEDSQVSWTDSCHQQKLVLDVDAEQRVQIIRVAALANPGLAGCQTNSPSGWKTGLGLRIQDPSAKVVQLYGPPDSKSPSTRDGQPLELWYYAFDWAGPDVPQVMEVLCTRETDGHPGKVVEITLAAPSL